MRDPHGHTAFASAVFGSGIAGFFLFGAVSALHEGGDAGAVAGTIAAAIGAAFLMGSLLAAKRHGHYLAQLRADPEPAPETPQQRKARQRENIRGISFLALVALLIVAAAYVFSRH